VQLDQSIDFKYLIKVDDDSFVVVDHLDDELNIPLIPTASTGASFTEAPRHSW
jgi:hypothetical protein